MDYYNRPYYTHDGMYNNELSIPGMNMPALPPGINISEKHPLIAPSIPHYASPPFVIPPPSHPSSGYVSPRDDSRDSHNHGKTSPSIPSLSVIEKIAIDLSSTSSHSRRESSSSSSSSGLHVSHNGMIPLPIPAVEQGIKDPTAIAYPESNASMLNTSHVAYTHPNTVHNVDHISVGLGSSVGKKVHPIPSHMKSREIVAELEDFMISSAIAKIQETQRLKEVGGVVPESGVRIHRKKIISSGQKLAGGSSTYTVPDESALDILCQMASEGYTMNTIASSEGTTAAVVGTGNLTLDKDTEEKNINTSSTSTTSEQEEVKESDPYYQSYTGHPTIIGRKHPNSSSSSSHSKPRSRKGCDHTDSQQPPIHPPAKYVRRHSNTNINNNNNVSIVDDMADTSSSSSLCNRIELYNEYSHDGTSIENNRNINNTNNTIRVNDNAHNHLQPSLPVEANPLPDNALSPTPYGLTLSEDGMYEYESGNISPYRLLSDTYASEYLFSPMK